MARLRQYHWQSARRQPAIDRGQKRPRLLTLDVDLDRRLLAEPGSSTICRCAMQRLSMIRWPASTSLLQLAICIKMKPADQE
ncbi:hypothetical protein BZM26_38235 [Paraburkholderia strydomiana]|nr:hypothetical protein BZM26_38235 [Paraburkholderia strydomiana]